MNYRKLCLILAIVSGVLILAGIIICVRTNRKSDAFDSVPMNLNNSGDEILREGMYCKFRVDNASEYLCVFDDGNGKQLRYYPAQVQRGEKTMILVCVPEDQFEVMDQIAAKNAKNEDIPMYYGWLRYNKTQLQNAITDLTKEMRAMYPGTDEDYEGLFLPFYLETVVPKDYSGILKLGLWMVIGGLVTGVLGGVGYWYFGRKELMGRLVSISELGRNGR
ncbi:MAG: hypothetical protein IKX54_05915 [Lachnospiraceae bacterium]|nr:hypothetical protein [Lachnospiraceae bacterium]